LARSCRC